MNSTAENPFDVSSLATGDVLFGREEELSWFDKNLRDGTNLLLFGPEGMGKSSVLQQAGSAFAERRGGFFVRLELSLHRTASDVARVLDAASAQIADGGPDRRQGGVLGDLPIAGLHGIGGGLSLPAVDSSASAAPLLQSLHQLNTLAEMRRLPLAIGFDSSQDLRRLGAALETVLLESTQRNFALTHVFVANEQAITNKTPEALGNLQGVFESRRVGPLEPHAFAQWIDRRFAASAIIPRGVGAACVDLAGPDTAQTIDLAQRTFQFSFKAKFANEATVRAAFDRGVAEQSDRYLALWGTLSDPEQKVLSIFARGAGQHIFAGENSGRLGLRGPEDVRSVVQQLTAKRFLENVGPERLRVSSAMFKQWAVTAGVSLGHSKTAGNVTTQSGRFHFSFHSTQSAATRRTPSL